MNDCVRSLSEFIIPFIAEGVLKAESSLKTARRNLSLDFKSLIQYNNKEKPFFRSRYETKHNN